MNCTKEPLKDIYIKLTSGIEDTRTNAHHVTFEVHVQLTKEKSKQLLYPLKLEDVSLSQFNDIIENRIQWEN
jgi:hypothetical protein